MQMANALDDRQQGYCLDSPQSVVCVIVCTTSLLSYLRHGIPHADPKLLPDGRELVSLVVQEGRLGLFHLGSHFQQ
jgi:hypothetical protein